ncbi:hypothetical protein D3C78_1296210 [compost metagenome]
MRRLLHEEAPVWPGDDYALADLQLLVYITCTATAWDDTDTQLDFAARRRGTGNRKSATANAVRQLQIDVLACLEAHTSCIIELDPDALDRRRQGFDAADRTGEIAHRQVLGIRILVNFRLNHQIAFGGGAAGQAFLLFPLEIHQGKAGGLAMFDLSIHHLNLAGRAQAVAAGVGQVDASAQGGVENGLAFLDLDRLTQRFNRQFVTHGPPLS